MDTTSFLNFHEEEHFSVLDNSYFLDPSGDESHSLDETSSQSTHAYSWGWDNEREINGDVALIPTSNLAVGDFTLSTSPPSKEDFTKIMADWQQLINVEETEDLAVEFNSFEGENFLGPQEDALAHLAHTNFDITTYIDQPEPSVPSMPLIAPSVPSVPSVPKKTAGPGGKRIDMQAQRYVLDDSEDDPVDVETVSEPCISPALEARDLDSLLEQFEAETEHSYSEVKSSSFMEDKFLGVPQAIFNNDDDSSELPERSDSDMELEDWKPDSMSHEKLFAPVLNQQSVTAKVIIKSKPVVIKQEIETVEHDIEPQVTVKSEPDVVCIKEEQPPRNKQIIDALPRELIDRIKQSSKRKPISVIPAKPSKKRGRHSQADDITSKSKQSKCAVIETPHAMIDPSSVVIKQEMNLLVVKQEIKSPSIKLEVDLGIVKHIKKETDQKAADVNQRRKSVQKDHDYCISCPYPKHPMKDSGFESAEEDERSVLRNQPTVKSADGKLMVSLLKTNTIRNNTVKQKRKLNLEEYKKRREIHIKSSASNSPISSGRESPLIIDENTRRIKHQELLMKMASEVLKAKHKEDTKPQLPTLTELPILNLQLQVVEKAPEDQKPIVVNKKITPPPNLEMKTLVSVSTNTEESWGDCRKLEDIKPILENASIKISPNSLLTSLIENIPKLKSKQKVVASANSTGEHGEDKTIVYLDKNRPSVVTCNAYVQTDEYKNDLIETRPRRGDSRRSSSSWSSRSRSSSRSSTSRSSRSVSRSRSPSPYRSKYKRRNSSPDHERIREVEERRVVYVGRISNSTSRDDMKRRFQCYGPISNVSVHFRTHGDNYGFVTFLHKLDAYEAVEHGNDDPTLPQYDLSFGGRRMFCKTSYSDLDNVRDEANYFSPRRKEDSFDNLLREVQAKLRRRKI